MDILCDIFAGRHADMTAFDTWDDKVVEGTNEEQDQVTEIKSPRASNTGSCDR